MNAPAAQSAPAQRSRCSNSRRARPRRDGDGRQAPRTAILPPRRGKELRRPQGGQGREPLRAARRGGRPARAERRRQDHGVLHDHRPDQGRPRPHRARRPRRHALPMYQRARLGIGYLPQEASIFRGLNVEDNIRSVLEVVEPDRRRREADLNALLEEFEIARLRKTPIDRAVGRRASPRRDRARAGDAAELHAARRAVRRHRSRSRSATSRRWCAI